MDFLQKGSKVIGLDISLPMLRRGGEKLRGFDFPKVLGDILNFPFAEGYFDRVVSVTALEFIEDGELAIRELFRVTKKGGCIVGATLNSLSPWAVRRKEEADKKQSLFAKAIFRSPAELLSLAPVAGTVRTAVHFQKDDDPQEAVELEKEGQKRNLNTGAFVAARWIKT